MANVVNEVSTALLPAASPHAATGAAAAADAARAAPPPPPRLRRPAVTVERWCRRRTTPRAFGQRERAGDGTVGGRRLKRRALGIGGEGDPRLDGDARRRDDRDGRFARQQFDGHRRESVAAAATSESAIVVSTTSPSSPPASAAADALASKRR